MGTLGTTESTNSGKVHRLLPYECMYITVCVHSEPYLFFSASRVKQLDSFVDCEGLNRFGRFSFNNYNKEVEVHVLW